MITFFFGGTFSSKGDGPRTVFGAGDPVAGTAQCREIARAMTGTQINTVLEWPGNFAYKVLWFPTYDPREKGAVKAARVINAWIKDALAAVDGPIPIATVGFSHGGNVAILAMDQVLLGARAWDKRLAWKMLTISTPPVEQYRDSAYRVAMSANMRWHSVAEADDPVVTRLAGLTDYLIPCGLTHYPSVGGVDLQTPLGGIPSHDKFPGSPELLKHVQGLEWR